MLTVIADDITGAAEIAGIAFARGLSVRLVMSVGTQRPQCDVLVVATDTRSMTRDEAVAETRRVAEAVRGWGRLFKKTDSALRGHVEAELQTLLSVSGLRSAVYLPANPSKGRIIRGGVYYVGDKPIAETDFRRDPEFPALSSSLAERFPAMHPYSGSGADGLFYADATTEADMRKVVAEAGGQTLLAGAADLFVALLASEYPQAEPADRPLPRIDLRGDIVIVRGSTLSKQLELGIPVVSMPADAYAGTVGVDEWQQAALSEYDGRHAVILSFGQNTGLTGKQAAVRLRSEMAAVASAVVSSHAPKELIVEGGATAYCLLDRLGWHDFALTDQIAPGVVRMVASNGTHVTLKPGSYPWGGLFANAVRKGA